MHLKTILSSLALTAAMGANAQQLAFPGAEGFGRFATGGRGGKVYHVTNLNDSGAGSFRDAVSQPNRIVVFDVSGVIHLKSAIQPASNLTIAGQTAPGDGITITDERISISKKQNIICRYLRVRFGMKGPDGKDAMGISDASSNMIFDHMSVTWGRDENFSINSTAAYDITIQNSIIGQGLQNHSCGGLIQTNTDHGITLYRNLYIDNKTRNPKVKGLNQFVNNVVYNWGDGAAYNMGGESAGESLTEIENNYFVKGPGNNYMNVRQADNTIAYGQYSVVNPTKPFTGGNEQFKTYCVGNFYDADKDGTLNGEEIVPATNWAQLCSGSPVFLTETPSVMPVIAGKTSAEEAYNWIVANVGASLPVRDQVDAYLIDELSSLGKKGTIIQDERNTTQFPIGGVGEIRRGDKLPDTDGDGMPDVWEDANGTDKNVDDAMVIAANGYANIENYINSISGPQPFVPGPATMKATSSTDEVTLSWTDSFDGETGYIIEQKDGAEWKVVATPAANATSYTVKGLAAGTTYTFRMKAAYAEATSAYSDELAVATVKVGTAPAKPTVVAPVNGFKASVGSSLSVTLKWDCVADEVSGANTFTVFFGESATSLAAISSATGISAKTTDVAVSVGKTYYWRIDVKNSIGTTTGDVWNFSTVELTEREPLIRISADGNLANTAPVAVALAAQGTKVDAVATGLAPAFADGKVGKGLVFPNNGDASAGQRIDVPFYAGLNFTSTDVADPSSSFSVAFWVKSDGKFPKDKAYLFHKGNFSSNTWAGIEARSGVLLFVVKGGSKVEYKAFTTTSKPSVNDVFDNQWHHLVFVRDHAGKAIVAYCDGKLVGQAACELRANSGEYGITFGNSQQTDANDEPFAGAMDEMMLFGGALSAEEVANLYATGTTSGKPVLSAQRVVKAQNVSVFPSVVTTHATVSAQGNNGAIRATVFNASGAQVAQAAGNGETLRVSTSSLPAGLYVLTVETAEGVASCTIVKK